MEHELREFIAQFEDKVVELSKNTQRAYFEASISGNSEDFKKVSKLQLQLEKIFTSKEDFRKIKEFKKSNSVNDEILTRQLELLYNQYAGSQISEDLLKQIIDLSTDIEKKYSTFRTVVGENKLSDNDIDKILEESKDSEELEKIWRASKQIGGEVAYQIIDLVKLRNSSARELGYDNYHQMSLELAEQSTQELCDLFDELDELTREEFQKLKTEIDLHLSAKLGVSSDKLMPWHYQDKYFQQGPKIYNVDLDKYFEYKNLEEITKNYYDSLGLNIDDLVQKSDLYEKDGKYQHAYCINIDRKDDTRVICNLKSNHRWMATMLHEFGHAAYEKFISPQLPWLLREPSHIFTTEAIAMMFGRFALNPQWLSDVIHIDDDEKQIISEPCFKSLKAEQLIFSRWVQVVFRFEKSMYENPDQDLNTLWWDLVEEYQDIKRPSQKPGYDWASKIHLALYPAYYHNYMLGELLASQLYYYISEKVISNGEENNSFMGKTEVGEYLKKLYFSYGSIYNWRKLIKHATGEELSPKYYAKQFIG